MLSSSQQEKREIMLESLDFTRVGNVHCLLMHTATSLFSFVFLLDCDDLQDYQGGANLYGAPMAQMPAQLLPWI